MSAADETSAFWDPEITATAMAGSLLADLSRMGSDNAFTDLVLTAQGGYQRAANSVVLAARSRVFKQMLSSEMQEGQLIAGKRHVDLPETSGQVLDQLLEWCYADKMRDLDLPGTMELLRAADCFELTGLLQKCSHRLGKILTMELLPEAIGLAEAMSSAELWHALALFVAKSDANFHVNFHDMPCELQTFALQERKKILEKNISELRLRLANVPAPRPAIVFWRQTLPESLHKDLVQEALLDPEAVPALVFGFREKAPVLFREACAKHWKELDGPTRLACEEQALEDQAKFEEAKSRLEHQLQDLNNELKGLVAGWLGLVAAGGALIGSSSGHPQVDGPGADAWKQGAKVPVAQSRVESEATDEKTAAQGQASAESSSASHDSNTVPEPPDLPESAGWQAQFAWGLYHSKTACTRGSAGRWALDRKGSRAGVPQEMLRAEELLDSAVRGAPAEEQRKKSAERALRLYYHAKWLAERNHATAAEWRYREASRLALQTRRKVLAAHALGRFGYFLIHWNRRQEAKEVLYESRRISAKSNPLAPYLLGVLERQDAGADLERLKAAEELILNGGEQPSEDLEAERQSMVKVIHYWREAQTSTRNCFASADAAFVAICLIGTQSSKTSLPAIGFLRWPFPYSFHSATTCAGFVAEDLLVGTGDEASDMACHSSTDAGNSSNLYVLNAQSLRNFGPSLYKAPGEQGISREAGPFQGVSSSTVLHGRLPAKPPGRDAFVFAGLLFLSVEGVFLLGQDMRICHGLAGEVLEVDSEYRKPLDLVRQYARERWNLQLEDLIVLTSSGSVLSAEAKEEDAADVYFFTKQCLETQAEVIPERLDVKDPSLARFGGTEGGSSLAFQQVVAAFEQLADPLLRRAYDQRCATGSSARRKVTKVARQTKSNAVTKAGKTKGAAMNQPDDGRSVGASKMSKNRATWKHRLLANVVKLLKAVPAADRKNIFTSRLIEAQRLELEAFIRASKAMGTEPSQVAKSGKTAGASKAPAEPFALCDHGGQEDHCDLGGESGPSGSKRKMKKVQVVGVNSFERRNQKFYRCVSRAEWMILKICYLKTLEEAIDQHIVLTSICERIRGADCPSMKERILEAVNSALLEHGFAQTDFKLVVDIYVPAKHWIGRDLYMSGFRLKNIDALASMWHRVRDARGPVSRGSYFNFAPTDATWLRLREIYLDFTSMRGKDREDAGRKIDRLFEQRSPVRERIWSRWNLYMMRRAEREQRESQRDSSTYKQRRQERSERRRMRLEDRLSRRVGKAHLDIARKRQQLDALLTTWGRVNEADVKRAERRRRDKRTATRAFGAKRAASDDQRSKNRAHEHDDVLGQRCEDVIDPAFEAFRSNIAEARARIAESRPVSALASRCEQRVLAQRHAARAVLENLKSHRAACGRSISLLVQKSNRVQVKLSDCLEKAESAIKTLESVALHESLQSETRRCLADVVPRDRILRFTEALEGEGAQLLQRLEKLQRQDSQLEGMCEQVAERVEQLIREDSVSIESKAIHVEQARAQSELPQLRVPSAGAAPATVLEDEKRSALLRDRVTSACANVRTALDQLQSCWDRQHQMFVQRLREVAYVQSKVRYVERQAALLEEEVNAQSNNAQHIVRLQKMPRAYNSALREVALRQQFRERYVAQAEKARTALSRMVEAENSRRRAFLQRYSCYLPADLVQGLGAFAPAITLEVPNFDAELPDIAMSSLEVPERIAGRLEAEAAEATSSLICFEASSDRPGPWHEAPGAEAKDAVATAESRIAELEARNKALEEQLAMRQEQAATSASET
eukprot:s118_g33.t3